MSTSTLSKTAAIKAARRSVSEPIGRGTSWTVYGPHDYADPAGPYTQRSATSYQKAARIRAAWVASVALELMGAGSEDAHWAAHDAESGSVNTRVEIGLKADR